MWTRNGRISRENARFNNGIKRDLAGLNPFNPLNPVVHKIIMQKSLFAIGIDLGGSHLTSALIDGAGHIKYQKTISFAKAPNGKRGIHLMRQLINKVLRHWSCNVRGIGISCPGSVDFDTGVVLADSPNLIGWKGTSIKRALESFFNIPVLIDNDGNLAAWGEKYWGAGKNATNLICLTLGTGVGGGIIIDGKIYRGSHFYAGEIGHLKISLSDDAPRCNCGQYGCLEALVSAGAIVREFVKLKCLPASGGAKGDSGLRLGHNITAKTVFDAARRGDKIAKQVVLQTASYLGNAISSLINIFDPDIVVIGGGMAQAGNILFKPVQQVVKINSMPHPLRVPTIAPAQLGKDAGLLGVAALVLSGECGVMNYNS